MEEEGRRRQQRSIRAVFVSGESCGTSRLPIPCWSDRSGSVTTEVSDTGAELRSMLNHDEDDNAGMEEEELMGAPAASRCHPIASPPPRHLTERDLMQIAQKLGREWQEVGIMCLQLEKGRLEQIQEDHPCSLVLQSFEMLCMWSQCHKAKAMAPWLCIFLHPTSMDPNMFNLLQD